MRTHPPTHTHTQKTDNNRKTPMGERKGGNEHGVSFQRVRQMEGGRTRRGQTGR